MLSVRLYRKRVAFLLLAWPMSIVFLYFYIPYVEAEIEYLPIQKAVDNLVQGRVYSGFQLEEWVGKLEQLARISERRYIEHLPFLYMHYYRASTDKEEKHRILGKGAEMARRALELRPYDGMAWFYKAVFDTHGADRNEVGHALSVSVRLAPMDERIYFARLRLLSTYRSHLDSGILEQTAASLAAAWRIGRGEMQHRIRDGSLPISRIRRLFTAQQDDVYQEIKNYAERHRKHLRRMQRRAEARAQ